MTNHYLNQLETVDQWSTRIPPPSGNGHYWTIHGLKLNIHQNHKPSIYQYAGNVLHRNLDLKFKAKLKLESGNQKIQNGHQAAILKVTYLKINRLLSIHTSNVLPNFGLNIQSQTEIRVQKPKKSKMATRQPFWKWHRWKSIGFCPWPPTTRIWNFKLKFQSKLELRSGTDRQTDKVIPVYIPPPPPHTHTPTLLGGGIMMA